MQKTYFIIGPNGVGKSTALSVLQKRFDGSSFDMHDFDERGVPDNAGKDWRQSETRYWIECGKKNEDTATIICGFAKPEEVEKEAQEVGATIIGILLDASPETIEKRLMSRYQTQESIAELARATQKTVEKFIGDNIYFSSILREECKKYGYVRLSTDNMTPEEVVDSLVPLLKQ